MFVFAVVLLVAIPLAACSGVTATSDAPSEPEAESAAPQSDQAAEEDPEPEITHVRLAMGFVPNVQYAPFYVADQKGYFAENGIEIDFDHSLFENDAVKLVGTDEIQFAIVSGEQVLLSRAQDIPLVYVFEWFQKYPIAVVSKSEAGIVEPSDLAGHSVGLPGRFGASYVGWRALLAEAGLTEDDVTTEEIGFTQVAAVSEDVVEAAVGYANNEPVQLTQAGYDVNVLYVSEYVDLVANGLVTNEKTLVENPDLVAAMVDAIARGLADVLADPDHAFTVSQDYVEGLDGDTADAQRIVLDESVKLWEAPRLGMSDLSSWEQTQTVLLDSGLLAEPQDLEAVFTNEFVP
jgi:NitT/TauT family transport system substrate-binding protein